jgi:hypothetical protein
MGVYASFSISSGHRRSHASKAGIASALGCPTPESPIRLIFQKDVSGFPPVSTRFKNGVAARGRTI